MYAVTIMAAEVKTESFCRRILCVGLAALDIVNTCERYPNEDEDYRAISQIWQTGGNACNTSTVLGELGIDCELFGTMSCGPQTDFLCKQIRERKIRYENCVFHKNCGRQHLLSC